MVSAAEVGGLSLPEACSSIQWPQDFPPVAEVDSEPCCSFHSRNTLQCAPEKPRLIPAWPILAGGYRSPGQASWKHAVPSLLENDLACINPWVSTTGWEHCRPPGLAGIKHVANSRMAVTHQLCWWADAIPSTGCISPRVLKAAVWAISGPH